MLQENQNSMAQLNSIIGSILRDIISAQHDANMYSLALSDTYGKDGKAKDFQLPNIMVSDMELELKYGIKSASESQQHFNILYDKFRQFLKELAKEVAKVTITSVVSTVMTSGIERKELDIHFFTRLQEEETLQRDFQAFLSRNLRNAFRNNLYDAVDTSSGTAKTDVLVVRFMDVIRKKFLYDSDLKNLFAGEDGTQLREQADTNVQVSLTGLIEKLARDANFKSLKTFPQLDVAITADELASMPEEAIHSFKLKFNPRSYAISQLDNDEFVEDFVMK